MALECGGFAVIVLAEVAITTLVGLTAAVGTTKLIFKVP